MPPRWLPSLRTGRVARLERDIAEARDLFQNSSRIPDWATLSGGLTYTGNLVTLETATGLPAVGAAIRLLSDTIAQLPLNVYAGVDAEKRLARDSWQFRLLTVLPSNGDFTAFDFVSDIVACVETQGNAYLQKVKASDGEVIALIVIDPRRVIVERRDGAKVFRVRGDDGREREYDAATILHIRGFTMQGSDVGLSPIAAHRQKLGSIQAQDEFQGRYFGQGTHIGVTLELPEGHILDPEEAAKLEARFERHHGGLANSHRPIILQNGAHANRMGLSLQDSQFVETANFSLTEVANIFRIPVHFLNVQSTRPQPFEQDNLLFYNISIAPRLRRIELALRIDPDLFPETGLYPEFDTRAFLRTDAKTQAEVDHLAIQDGSLLVDEVRASKGMPPLPPMPEDPTQAPGKVPQITPVGGHPTPAPLGAGDGNDG